MFIKKKKPDVQPKKLPVHIGIIMDGNGRWAQKRKLPRSSGHTAGASNFRSITRYASKIGIRYLTMYAFSTENWNRPDSEVGALLKLFQQYLEEALADFMDENIRVRFLGDIAAFPKDLQQLIRRVEKASAPKTGMVLNLAMNYGGRAELVHAFEEIAAKQEAGTLPPGKITQQMVSDHLYTGGQPDPDLIIRPSGEERLSNFMIWQSAYAEFVFFDILWPDFKPKDLDHAIEIYSERKRRFGGIIPK